MRVPAVKFNWPVRTPLIWSILAGSSFGLLLRLAAAFHWFPNRQVVGTDLTAVMALSYLVLGSAGVGYVTVWCAEIKVKRRVWQWIVAPWCSALFMILGSAAFLLEGTICLVFAFPIVMVFASIGGIVAGVIRRKMQPGIPAQLCLLALPLVLPQVETQFATPRQVRTVETEVRIFARPSIVWKNIASVSPIRAEELPKTWTEELGFPRPIAATLSYEGIGGIRNATFERGLTFIETVTAWEPNRQISFTIKADTAHIPPSTLDSHATIGGAYFDVLDGDYQIEEAGDAVVLHLRSHERLSTNFNVYAGLWTDAVMGSIQKSILQVIKHRSEAKAGSWAFGRRRLESRRAGKNA